MHNTLKCKHRAALRETASQFISVAGVDQYVHAFVPRDHLFIINLLSSPVLNEIQMHI